MWVFACYIFLERWGKIFHHFVHVLLCSDYINHMFFVNVSSDADNGLCLWGNDEKMLKCLAVGNLNIIKSWCFSPWKKKKRKKKKEIRIIYKAHMQIIFRFRRILMSFKFQMSGLYDDFSFPDIFPPSYFRKQPSVMENISLILPIFISHLAHIQLPLTRMHQAQENIKRVKRKSNGLRQFECESRGKSFVSS